MTCWHDDMMTWWHDDMMTWWHDDLMTWWHVDMMTWWHDDMMTCWHDDMLTWWHGDMVTWWHGDMVTWWPDYMMTWWHVDMMTWWHDDMMTWSNVFCLMLKSGWDQLHDFGLPSFETTTRLLTRVKSRDASASKKRHFPHRGLGYQYPLWPIFRRSSKYKELNYLHCTLS